MDEDTNGLHEFWWIPDRLADSYTTPLGKVIAHVHKYATAAFEGDARASSALVRIAEYASLALEAIWEGVYPVGLSSERDEFREAQREILRRIARERETWPILSHCRAARTAKTAQMLRELELGTRTALKAVDVADDSKRDFIERLCILVGMPSAENVKEWIKKVMAWVEEDEVARLALRTPKTVLYEMANPIRQLRKRRDAAMRRLKRGEKRKRSDHHTGKLSVEEADEKQQRIKKIKEWTVTEADLKTGLREALSARVKSLARKRTQK